MVLGSLFKDCEGESGTNLYIYTTPHIVDTSESFPTEKYEKMLKENMYQRFIKDLIIP